MPNTPYECPPMPADWVTNYQLRVAREREDRELELTEEQTDAAAFEAFLRQREDRRRDRR